MWPRRPPAQPRGKKAATLLLCLSAFALTAGCAHVAPDPNAGKAASSQPSASVENEKPYVLTEQAAWDLYARYVEGWKAISDAQRTKIASEVLAADLQYTTPRHQSGGFATVVGDMETFQSKFPGGHFDIGDVSAHHDVALLTWVLVQADGKIVARGHDQIQASSDGKISRLTTFAPSKPCPGCAAP